MLKKKGLFITLFLFSVGLLLSFLHISNLPTQGQELSEQSPLNETPLSRSTVAVKFYPPNSPGDPKPTNTVRGGSRDGGICFQNSEALEPSLTPLIPVTRQGLTVAEHPIFFVYVPKTSAQKALFVLKDENEDYYYQKIFSIPGNAGVISFRLPTDAPAIEIGKSYQWSVTIICGEALEPDNPGVEGQIQRIEPNPALRSLTENLVLLERAASYGKSGIWYDAIATLAELKRLQPNDSTLAANWEELLRSVGLEAIATKPLLQ